MITALNNFRQVYFRQPMLTLLFLGFASGLPAPLVFSNLSIWLRDEGVSRTDIGLFALVTTPYAINFLWAPLIDKLRLPFLTAWLGQRRSWILFTQVALFAAILWMGSFSPGEELAMVALGALLVTIASATQDIAVDAFRIDSLSTEEQGAGASVAIWGWHLGGTLIGGAGGLYLASAYGWHIAYWALAFCLVISMLAVLLGREPERKINAATEQQEAQVAQFFNHRMPRIIANTGAWLVNTVIAPFYDFMKRDGWWLTLLFVFIFKFGDAMLGRMSGVFYREMGFSYEQIANVGKVYGFIANMVGIAIGGWLANRLGLVRALLISGFLAALTNLTYSLLAQHGGYQLLVLAVVSDNLTSGLVTVAFVAYLSSLCNVAYSATQYALLASLGNLSRIWLSASSGYVVDSLNGDWSLFFQITALLALAGLPLLLWLAHRYPTAIPGHKKP